MALFLFIGLSELGFNSFPTTFSNHLLASFFLT